MKKLLLVWIIVAISLTLGLTFIGINLQSKNRAYYNIENSLRDASKLYLAQFPQSYPSKELVITSSTLIEVNYLEHLTNEKEKCDGYVVVSKNYMNYKYTPYIKCDSYHSKNYNKSLAGNNK